MINDFDLTPEELKQQYAENIAKFNTFETSGVSKQAAKNYLETPEGEILFDRLSEASPGTPLDKIEERAISQLTSGSQLPRLELINEPLVKIVPKGQTPSAFSPYWMRESDLNAAIARGDNLSKAFALPIASEAAEYDVYKITPKAATEVFVSHIAPSVELEGQIVKQGGGIQYITPNRQVFTTHEFVKSVENRIFIPHQKELQIPSDLKNPVIQTIGGVSRTELAQLHDELTTKHGYSRTEALDAVNARTTLNTAINDLQTGKPLNTSPEVLRSHTITRHTATILGDAGHEMSKQVTAYNLAHNGASPELVQAALNAQAQPVPAKSAFQLAHNQITPEPELITHRPHSVMTLHINDKLAGETKNIIEFKQEQQIKIEAQAQTRAAGINEARQQLEAQVQARVQAVEPHISPAHSQTPHMGAKVVAGVDVAVQAAAVYDDTTQAIRHANSTREQWTQGGAALTSGSVKTVVTGVAGFGGGVAGGLGGAATLVPGGAAIGAYTLGTAAAIGTDKLYTDSIVDKGFKGIGSAGGDVGYNYLSPEGKALRQIGELQQQISQTNDPAKQRELQERLARTSHTYSSELDKNNRQRDATHAHDATFAEFQKANPKYPVSSATVDTYIGDALKRGYSGQAAVDNARFYAVEAQKASDAQSLARLSEVDRQAAVNVFNDNPGATMDKSIELIELAKDRNAVTPGGYARGEAVYQNALNEMQQANHNADPTYGKDPRDRAIEQYNQQLAADTATITVTAIPDYWHKTEYPDRTEWSRTDGHSAVLELPNQTMFAYNKAVVMGAPREDFNGSPENGLNSVYFVSPAGQQLKVVTPEDYELPLFPTTLKQEVESNWIKPQVYQDGALIYDQNKIGEVQPQAQTVTAEVRNTPEPITQTAVPVMAIPVQSSPVQLSPSYAAPAMTSATVATAEIEPPARQVENVPQSAQPIVLPRNLASLHAQLTEKFGNQLDHLSEKDQQTTIALATLEAAKFNVRTVDQIFISPKGDVLMSFDQQRTCSGDINLAQVPQYDANQVLEQTISLQQSQQQALAQRQSQSQGGPTMTM
jgi:hypothetical protein